MSDLPKHHQSHPNQRSHAIAFCLHGDKLSLTRLWGSVKVELNFNKTEVHTYEADR